MPGEHQSTDPVEAVAKAIAWETLTPKGKAECRWPHDWAPHEAAMFRLQAKAALAAAFAAMGRRFAT